jgi:hypothetical protein
LTGHEDVGREMERTDQDIGRQKSHGTPARHG